MNTVCITGYMGGEVELRQTSSGKEYATFLLSRFSAHGQVEISILVEGWGRVAEVIASKSAKKSRISVEGRLSRRNGNIIISAHNIELLDWAEIPFIGTIGEEPPISHSVIPE